MSDIFISYKREDKEGAELLANKLTASGWKVWWDHDLLGGQDYDVVIERELNDAKCVVVIWSALSVKSRNVKDEARNAINRDILVPVSFDNTEPPIGFGMTQVVLFKNKYAVSDAEYKKLYDSIAQKIATETPVALPPESPSFFKQYRLLIVALLVAAVLAIIYFTRSPMQGNIDPAKLDTGTTKGNIDSILKPPVTGGVEPTPGGTTDNTSGAAVDNAATDYYQEAEKLANDFMNAIKTKNAEAIVAISSTPFYSDNKILTSSEEIRNSFQAMMDARGAGEAFPAITSIKVKKVAQWKKEGLITSDRILDNMHITDDDYYAAVFFGQEAVAVAFRFVNKQLKVAGFWD